MVCYERHKLINKKVNHCYNCGKETKNSKYCSKHCSAVVNNNIPKRQRKFIPCQYCGREAIPRNKYCKEHKGYRKIENYISKEKDWSQISIKDYKGKHQYNDRLPRARNIYIKANLPMQCKLCGYDKFVEICHIKAIHTFPENTPISIINSLDNLIALCPNCHWEFDHK